jgi:hypothetical protein
MLLRISLFLAIIAALAAGTLSYFELTQQVPALTQQRDNEKSAKETVQGQLVRTNAVLVKTRIDLAQTQQDLADAQAARKKAEDTADAQTKRADEIAAKLAGVTQERDDAQNQLAAYKATSLTPEQILQLNKTIKDAQAEIDAINGEKMVLQRRLFAVQAELDKLITPEKDITLRADLRGKIITVDPKWDFVVLNIGDDQGVLKDGEMLVSRGGKLVAKVVVRSVQKDHSIANIVPGWKLGDPIEGDDVSPAHPAPAS